MTFDHNKPFRTKCGWPARKLGILDRSAFPLVVAVSNPAFGNKEELHVYPLDGHVPASILTCNDPTEETDYEADDVGCPNGALSLVNEESSSEAAQPSVATNASHTNEATMIEMNDQTLGFVVRQFTRASDRAHMCVAHFHTTNKDEDRCSALLAVGEASGLRNLLRHLMKDLPTEVAANMYDLDQTATQLTHAGK